MTLDQSILQHFSALPTQNRRFVKLHTPVGKDVFVAESVEIDEAIGPLPQDGEPAETVRAGFRVVVHALCGDTHLELKSLMGQGVRVEQLSGRGTNDYRPWHGHVTQAALLGSDGGLARYRLVIEPWLAFLAERQDSWVFQGQTVPQIIDEVFADYQAQGKLMPQWRWELADPNVYAQRSLCLQYKESDLAFVQRLLREEGLFYWWEHCAKADTADSGSASDSADELGSHTLVIADHNGAFQANPQARMRFTQGGASLNEDSLWRWSEEHRVQTASLHLASADYRTLNLRPVSQSGAQLPQTLAYLGSSDVPGQYAYEDSAQGERLIQRQIEALDAQRNQIHATAGVRSAAAGSYFTLAEHPLHSGVDELKDRFIITRARHRAHNNLQAEQNQILHQCELQAQPLSLPVRMPDGRLNQRPTISGVQTALVVGRRGEVHTDRDQRIKVQFHWQRSANSSHRLSHPGGQDNAPATDTSGTWVRVLTPVAGANWGSVLTPRLGQEVLIAFVGGDIDRPVVIGNVYNGQGQTDAQGNQINSGAAGATGNAPAWFPGVQHSAVLSGLKSQELGSSKSGSGGYNQLVFDDSPQASRIELSSTQAATRLQLGHLLHQNDNQRQQSRGHGLDLMTQSWGAVRAGAGLLISAHGKPGSSQGGGGASGGQMDSCEPLSQITQSQQLLHTLAQSAQDHRAQTLGEPQVKGATEKDKIRQLPAEQALWATQSSLKESQSQGGAESTSGPDAIGGGTGSTAAWSRPDLVIAAPGGITQSSAQSGFYSAGGTTSVLAGQDLNQLSAANTALAAKEGIVLYTYGKAQNGQKPNSETGIKLHAAAGNVNTQSQSDATHITADKAVQVSSTHASINASSPTHILLTAGGAGIKISGGNITLSAPGNITFKAGMKNLTGGGSKAALVSSPELPKLDGSYTKQFVLYSLEGEALKDAKLEVYQSGNRMTLWQGGVNGEGKAELKLHDRSATYFALAGYDGWSSEFESIEEDWPADDFSSIDLGESDEDGREEEARLGKLL